MSLDWYNDLVRGATASLSKMFDPNYNAVRAATMQSPYSDSRGIPLHEMFQKTRPILHDTHQVEPFYNDGWDVNRVQQLPIQRFPYKGML